MFHEVDAEQLVDQVLCLVDIISYGFVLQDDRFLEDLLQLTVGTPTSDEPYHDNFAGRWLCQSLDILLYFDDEAEFLVGDDVGLHLKRVVGNGFIGFPVEAK